MLDISIVIPTFNRLNRLKQVLTAIEAQQYPKHAYEVIVVSDGSTDGTNEYLRTYQTPLTFKPVVQDNKGVAAARNAGIARASGKIILFVDDDVVASPHLIAEHLRFHEQHGAMAVVMGPMLTPSDFVMAPWVSWEQAMLYKQYEAMAAGRFSPTPRQFYTGNASLGHHYLTEAGGFDESFRRAEDVELAYRLGARGLKFVFNPDAIGYHYAERTFQSWLDIALSYGRNDVLFARERGQPWILPQITREFKRRHPLIRVLTRMCIGRQGTMNLVTSVLTIMTRLTTGLGLQRLTRHLYSGLFNLRYYHGVALELDGRQNGLKLLA